MSEPEIKDKKPDVIETNVAQVVSERDHAVEIAKTLTDRVAFLEKENEVLQARIDEDTKAGLINEIAPMTNVPRDMLALKTVDQLKDMKKILTQAKIPAFKAGTPVSSVDRSPEAKLANAFDDFAKNTWRKN